MVLEAVYTPKQLAELLQVSEQVIADELKSGRLVGFRVGRQWRITESSVREYIKNNTACPDSEDIEPNE